MGDDAGIVADDFEEEVRPGFVESDVFEVVVVYAENHVAGENFREKIGESLDGEVFFIGGGFKIVAAGKGGMMMQGGHVGTNKFNARAKEHGTEQSKGKAHVAQTVRVFTII